MDFFGRRKNDFVPLPETVSGKAVLEINKFVELGVVALVSLFFGTMWYGVIDSSKRLVQIEGKVESLATKEDQSVIKADILLLKQRSDAAIAEGIQIQGDMKDIDLRVRNLEQKK